MVPIFDTTGTSPAEEACTTGAIPGQGTYFCLVCGCQLALRETDRLPECPRCGTSRFRRDSIFASLQEHGAPTVEFAIAEERQPPGWLDEARKRLAEPGYHLVMREADEIIGFHLEIGWSKIGRCPNAEINLDHPSVSRRHAALMTDPGKPPRILDDRSLNGVLVNGRRTEWAELKAGDELTIGCYRLYLLHA
ncbi:MAG: FHA domain-containing protein [Actinomycetota bacterium]|nr:FHA domain-containing protein [Actinomycetota bacterium]